jgi:outer membrane protein OmpA-like peptidoglycan-associated protein
MWLGGDQVKVPQSSSNGPGGQLLLGYKWSPEWDVALAGDIQGLMTELTKFRNGTLSVDTRYQHVDLELGYSFEWWRFNFGLRGIHYKQGGNYNTPSFSGYDQREMHGIGPKVGVGARFGIADDWAIVGSADAALLFTSFYDFGNGALINNGSYWGVVPQLGAELGINWRSSETPSFSVTVGGRIAASFNTAITASTSNRGTLVDYGPFVRIAYNFAGAASRRQAVVAEAAPASPSGGHGYTVFFGFDRAEISPVAAATLRRAADDWRRGRPVEIRISAPEGRRDRDDELSRRRADAVRAQLLHHGLAEPAVQRVQISY